MENNFWKNYQEQAWKTCLPSCQNIEYLGNAFIAEAGELAGVAAKKTRGDYNGDPEKHKQLLIGEVGDCLWFLFGLKTFWEKPFVEIDVINIGWYPEIELDISSYTVKYLTTGRDVYFFRMMDRLNTLALYYGFTLEGAAEYNLVKLAKRYENNLIMGSGDLR